ncbi:MAG: hypothetical protein IPJ71_15285 [Bdellovibrionales bacterium]|nr:hypothetical protein [Bdellovibrionales bacterium]
MTFFRFAAPLCIVLTLQSPLALGMSCGGALAGNLTAEGLGSSWRNAHWRNGHVPFSYYNFDALDRVVEDPDLLPLAVRWKALNESPTAYGKFMDITYQYLVYLADIRIKNRIPPGGIPNQPKPQLAVLTTMFDAYEAQLDTKPIVTQVGAYLKEFVHLDAGFDNRRSQEAFDFLNKKVVPAQMNLSMALSFSRP